MEHDILDPDGNVIGTENVCESTPVDDPDVAFGLPPDDCFAPATDPLNWFNPVPCPSSVGPLGSEARIGDGDWSEGLLQYWKVNHDPTVTSLDDLPTTACVQNPLDAAEQICISPGMTRYRMYLYEIASGTIPDNQSGAGATGRTDGENGAPQCYGGGEGTLTSNPDRRRLSVAVINCDEWGMSGNSVPSVDAEFFADMFVLRPIRGQSDYNIWLEFIKFSSSGDEAVHDLVQLYR